MLNPFRNQLSDDDKSEILISACSQIYKEFESTLSSSLSVPRKKQKDSLKRKIKKEALFTFIFLFISRLYIENSQYKYREQVMGGALRKIYYDYWRLQDLDRNLINTDFSSIYNDLSFANLNSYLATPKFNMPIVNAFIKRVLGRKRNLSRVKLNRVLNSILKDCQWYVQFHLRTQNF